MVVKKKVALPKKASAKKVAVKKVAIKKVVAKKAPAKKVAVKKVAVKKVVAKKALAKKVAVKKVAIKKVVAKKAPAKKVAVKKVAVKKVAVKKVVAKKVVAPTPAVASPLSQEPLGLPEQMRDAALLVLDERQAEDVMALDVRGRSAIADHVIIASGRSARQLAAMADYIREAFFKLGVKRVRVEGLPQGDWVLIDAGDIILHLFRPEVRAYYHIETIWSATTPVETGV